jgi:tripartite ATP-independent transporter DctM subunit
MAPLLALIGGVLGTVYLGVCTPSESAAVGALGALIIALAYRKLTRENLTSALLAAIKTNAMIVMIFIGGLLFSHVLSFMGLSKLVVNAVLDLEVNRWVIMIGLNLLLLVLGCFIDPGSIIIIVTPLALPVIESLGFDAIWFGVIFTINMEMANITPPLGYNLYVLKGVVPAEVKLQDIILGMLPFLLLFAISLAIVMIFPELALWLPGQMIKGA